MIALHLGGWHLVHLGLVIFTLLAAAVAVAVIIERKR
jgi:hypothetical protein